MVPGRGRNHLRSPRARFLQVGHEVAGPTDLERAGPLELLALEQDVASGQPRERMGMGHRRHPQDRPDRRPGVLDVAEVDHAGVSLLLVVEPPFAGPGPAIYPSRSARAPDWRGLCP